MHTTKWTAQPNLYVQVMVVAFKNALVCVSLQLTSLNKSQVKGLLANRLNVTYDSDVLYAMRCSIDELLVHDVW